MNKIIFILLSILLICPMIVEARAVAVASTGAVIAASAAARNNMIISNLEDENCIQQNLPDTICIKEKINQCLYKCTLMKV